MEKNKAPSVTAGAQSTLVKRRDGRTVAPWDSAAAKASLGLECSKRNMFPIHVGQEIMLCVPPSCPPPPQLPHPGACLSASQQGSLHLSLYPSAISFFVFLSIFLWFFETNSFFPLPVSCSGNLHSVAAVPLYSEPVAADCIPVCHLAKELKKTQTEPFIS